MAIYPQKDDPKVKTAHKLTVIPVSSFCEKFSVDGKRIDAAYCKTQGERRNTPSTLSHQAPVYVAFDKRSSSMQYKMYSSLVLIEKN
ncbi:hypothetical protein P5673_003716 [Acropora cervicornis]|uniref:Uncharacterized protein n=1 Tax=Acropora cervicornis TaxID=6130 RepID=A0AAD9R109_ACRCE|nr:hypothetical protein P5673_003716 [Acropora cervicornis]